MSTANQANLALMPEHSGIQRLSQSSNATPLQLENVLEYYAIPATQAVTLGFGRVDVSNGFTPFLFNHTGFDGFVVRIPCGRLLHSANTPRPFEPSNLIDNQDALQSFAIPPIHTSNLDPPLSSASTSSPLLWADAEQPIGNVMIEQDHDHDHDHDHSGIPSSPTTDLSPWVPQVQNLFAIDAPGNMPIEFGSEPLIADRNVNSESTLQASVKPIIEENPASGLENTGSRIFCKHAGCQKSFTRDADRVRHCDTVHQARQIIHRCPVAGCAKRRERGYSRADKLTEHMWRMHADLGYTKTEFNLKSR